MLKGANDANLCSYCLQGACDAFSVALDVDPKRVYETLLEQHEEFGIKLRAAVLDMVSTDKIIEIKGRSDAGIPNPTEE